MYIAPVPSSTATARKSVNAGLDDLAQEAPILRRDDDALVSRVGDDHAVRARSTKSTPATSVAYRSRRAGTSPRLQHEAPDTGVCIEQVNILRNREPTAR